MHKPQGEQFRLATDRTVYSYTQLGSGRSSEIPRSRWKIATFAKELNYLVAAWGLSNFHLMGGSWGSSLAIEYYLRYKGLGVKSLVLQSPLISASDWQQDANRLKKQLPDDVQKVIHYCEAVNATDAKVYEQAVDLYYSRHVLRNAKKRLAAKKRKNPNGTEIYKYMWGPKQKFRAPSDTHPKPLHREKRAAGVWLSPPWPEYYPLPSQFLQRKLPSAKIPFQGPL